MLEHSLCLLLGRLGCCEESELPTAPAFLIDICLGVAFNIVFYYAAANLNFKHNEDIDLQEMNIK